MQFPAVTTLEQWRTHAREFLNREVPPEQIHWNSDDQSPGLFDRLDSPDTANPSAENPVAENPVSKPPVHRVPTAFLELATRVAAHRDAQRWEILYRTLWRLTHGEKHLLSITTDDDVYRLVRMRKSVDRDVHKMKAFVRFRKIDGETYIAWYRSDHRILTLAAPFFARRFKGMNWSILTPDQSVYWDQSSLKYGPGVPASAAPDGDDMESLWKTYYASIFNPARVKIKAMKAEMPVRFWDTMPETELIPDLIRQADTRVRAMITNSEGFSQTATSYFPAIHADAPVQLSAFEDAATRCQACDLHRCATGVVFGRGPASARVVLIGEQPGDQEDLVGRPFVGPAGQLLDQTLAQVGVDRDAVYVTNVVKHFKFTKSGPRRLHKKPSSREIYACRPWMEAELAIIQPSVIVCLGSTPSQAIFGRDFRVSTQRGQVFATEWCDQTIATWHPAAILRTPSTGKQHFNKPPADNGRPDRQQAMRDQLTADLALIPNLLRKVAQ